MASGQVKELRSVVDRLLAERKAHEEAVAEIDAAFEQLGVEAPAPARSARAGKTPTARRRKRRRFNVTGKESILSFVRQASKNGRTGAEIERRWKSEGRSGSSYKELGELVHAGKVKRHNLKGQRGSRYTAR